METATRPSFQMHHLPPTMYAFIRRWVKWSEVPQFFNEGIEQIVADMQNAGMTPQYPPSMFIHKYNQDRQESELSVAVQTNSPVSVKGGGTIEFPAGRALIGRHLGPLDTTGIVHDAINGYIKNHDWMIGIIIEEYRSSLSPSPNPDTWETGIIYRLYDGVEVPRILC